MTSDDEASIADHARGENDWVRARIIKQEPPVEGSLRKIAERARDMAANSLGKEHPAYAVALQNLGLYYDAIENDAATANELFAQARAVVPDDDLPLADGFYWLGIFHYQVKHDGARAEPPLAETLAIQRRALGGDDLQLARTIIALAYAKGVESGLPAAIALTKEALRIQRANLEPTDQAVLDTENRLAMLEAVARA